MKCLFVALAVVIAGTACANAQSSGGRGSPPTLQQQIDALRERLRRLENPEPPTPPNIPHDSLQAPCGGGYGAPPCSR